MAPSEPFFIAGHALGPEAPSYVARAGDDLLQDRLAKGDFCLLQGPAHSGKSSLLVRTAVRLRSQGILCALVDFGSFRRGQSAEEVFDAILESAAMQFGGDAAALRHEIGTTFAADRLAAGLRHLLAGQGEKRAVLLLDDLDALDRLALPTAPILSALRGLYDRRAGDPLLARLSVCMATAAEPAAYGVQEKQSPFPVSALIFVSDFTPGEAMALARGLEKDGRSASPMLARTLYWTSGHPFLTQRLCRAVTDDAGALSEADVDRICREVFFTPEARDRDENLRYVRDSLLRGNVERPGALALYAQILGGKAVDAGSADPRIAALRRAGVLSAAGGKYGIRNRIYANAFDRDWVAANLASRARPRRRPAALAATAAAALVIAGMVGVVGQRQGWFERQKPTTNTTVPATPSDTAKQPSTTGEQNRVGKDIPETGTPEDFAKSVDARLARERAAAAQAEKRRQTAKADAGKKTRPLSPLEAEAVKKAASADATMARRRREAERRVREARLRAQADASRPRVLPAPVRPVAVAPAPAVAQAKVTQAEIDARRNAARIARQRQEEAEKARLESERQAQLARARGEAERVAAARLSVANGQRLESQGDLLGSLLWYAEARNLEREQPERERIHALRFAGALQQAPRLAQTWMPGVNGTALGFGEGGIVYTAPDGKLRLWKAGEDSVESPGATGEAGTRVIGLSPNGDKLLTQAGDGTVRLRDARSGAAMGEKWSGVQRLIRTAIGANGNIVAAQDATNTLYLWNGRSARTLMRLPNAASALSINADGTRVAAAWSTPGDDSAPGEAAVWTLGGEDVNETRLRQDRAIRDLRLSPDGRYLLLAGQSGSALYELSPAPASGDSGVLTAPARRLWARPETATDAAFQPDGTLVAIAGGETVRLLQASTGKDAVAPITGGTAVRDVRFSPDGGRIAISGGAGYARVFSARSGEAVTPPLRHPRSVQQAVFSPDGRFLLTTDQSGGARAWDLLPPETASGRTLTAARTQAIAFSPDGRTVVAATADGAAHRFSTNNAQEIEPALRHGVSPQPNAAPAASVTVNDVVFDSAGERILTAGSDGVARLWNAATGTALGQPLAGGASITRARFSRDGRQIVTGTQAGGVALWDGEGSGQRAAIAGLPYPVVSLEFSPSGTLVGIGTRAPEGDRGASYIWNTMTQQRLDLEDSGSGIVRFSPDGSAVITAAGPLARIRESATGLVLAPAMAHGAAVQDAVFSPDGARVATASEDGTARVWDAKTGLPVTPALAHSGPVGSVRFGAGGALLLSASANGSARLWDATTGEAVMTLPYNAPLALAVFGPGERQVAAASEGAALWELPQPAHTADEAMRLAEVLAAARIDRTASGTIPAEPVQLARAWVGLHRERTQDFVAGADTVRAGFERADHEHEQAGRWPEAIQALSALIEMSPDDPALLERRAAAYVKIEKWELAAADASRAVKIAPERIALWQILGDASMAREDYAGAVEAYSRGIEREPRSVPLWNLRGVARYQMGQFEQAREDFTQAIARDSNDAQLYLNRAAAYRGMGRMQEDLADVTRATELSPADPAVWSQRAEVYADHGLWEQAVSDYTQAASLERSPVSYSTLAVARLAAGDPAGYRETCDQMIQQFGNTRDAVVDVVGDSITARTCALLPEGIGEPARIVELSAQAVAKAPENPEIQRTHGFVLYRAGQYARAIAYLTAALQRQSAEVRSNPWIGGYEYLTLAMAYQQLGRAEDAQKTLNQGLAIVDDALKGRIPAGGRMLLWHQRVELASIVDEAREMIRRTGPVALGVRRRIEALADALPRGPAVLRSPRFA